MCVWCVCVCVCVCVCEMKLKVYSRTWRKITR